MSGRALGSERGSAGSALYAVPVAVIMAWLAVVIPVQFRATIRRFVRCGLSLPRNTQFLLTIKFLR